MTTSVVVATYNGMPYLEEQLDSIRKQTISADQVLISDDGSTDGTCKFVCEYIKRYNLSKWKLIQREKNLGWKKNFIETMKLASEDVIFLSDQDDIWMPDKIERYVSAFQENEHIKTLVSNYTIFYDVSQRDQQVFDRQVKQMINDGSVLYKSVNKGFHITDRPGCVYAVRRSFFEKIVNCYVEGHPHDSFLWLAASTVGGLYIIQAPFIRYRRHASNAIRKKTLSTIKLKERIAFSKREQAIIDAVQRTVLEIHLSCEENRHIEMFKKFCEIRVSFMETAHIVKWLRLCICYREFYASWKSVFADLAVTIKGEKV